MRAFAHMTALAGISELTTAVLQVAESSKENKTSDFLFLDIPSSRQAAASWLRYRQGRTLLHSIDALPVICRLAAPFATEKLADEESFDYIFVLRLYMAGTVLPFLKTGGTCHYILDIDENDGSALREQATLHDQYRQRQKAKSLRAEATALDRFAAGARHWFDTITSATDLEAKAIPTEDHQIMVLPNTIIMPNAPKEYTVQSEPDMLFVGNLDYLPNHDAARRLAKDILPIVRRAAPRVRLTIAGKGAESLKNEVAHLSGVTWLGYVPDLGPVYERSHLAVVPLRAGGGSRLKILEAFAKHLPVVATSKALEGLAINPGQHALLAESDNEIAMAVLQLITDRSMSMQLAMSAAEFVRAHHSTALVTRRMAAILREKKDY